MAMGKWALGFALGLCAACPAWADAIVIRHLTGGGEAASGGGLKLNGAILEYALPAGASSSANSSLTLDPGFYRAAYPVIYTAADPVWLRWTATPATAGALSIQARLLLEPENHPLS
jgi:hypothetical protein